MRWVDHGIETLSFLRSRAEADEFVITSLRYLIPGLLLSKKDAGGDPRTGARARRECRILSTSWCSLWGESWDR